MEVTIGDDFVVVHRSLEEATGDDAVVGYLSLESAVKDDAGDELVVVAVAVVHIPLEGAIGDGAAIVG